MSARIVIRWISRSVHRRAVAEWHSHHAPSLGETFALGGFVAGAPGVPHAPGLVAAAVMGVPVAPELQDGATWEVPRLAVGPDAPRFTAPRLLGACGRVMDEAGVDRHVSYTRVDEKGACFKGAGWRPVAYCIGRDHGTAAGGNRATWLPGLHEPSTEAIDRVRWERGARAQTKTLVEWDTARGLWLPKPDEREAAA